MGFSLASGTSDARSLTSRTTPTVRRFPSSHSTRAPRRTPSFNAASTEYVNAWPRGTGRATRARSTARLISRSLSRPLQVEREERARDEQHDEEQPEELGLARRLLLAP